MKLLELFTILELKDRLSYAYERYGKQVALRLNDDYEENNHIPSRIPLSVDPADYNFQPGDQKRYKSELKRLIGDIRKEDAPTIIDFIAQFDPTKNYKYLDWMVRQYTNGKITLEDAYKMEDLLTDFDDYKKGLKQETLKDAPLDLLNKNLQDLNSWTDYRDLAKQIRFVKDQGRVAGVRVKNFMKKDEVQSMMKHPVPDPSEFSDEGSNADVDGLTSDKNFDTYDWYDSDMTLRSPKNDSTSTTEIKPILLTDRIAVLQPNTKRASCFLGKGTEWCTGATSSWNAYWEHATEGPLYVVLTDKHGKFQWHFESNQFMDEHDDSIPEETLYDIVNEYPELRKVFEDEALKYGKIWLMDPAEWTPERLEGYMKGEAYSEMHHPHDVLFDMPKSWDGKAPEETLLMIEKMIREKGDPQHNWRNVRHPTDEDFLAAIQAPNRGTSGYNPVSNIMSHVRREGIELSDEVLEAAVARDGNAITRMSPREITTHPQWAAAAVYDDPRVLRKALNMSMESADWGEHGSDFNDKEIGVAILKALDNPEGIKAVTNSVTHDPLTVADMGGYFGTTPWMQALSLNNIDEADRDGIISYIDDRSPPLDYVQLLTYLIKQKSINGHEIHAIEKQMPGGKIPVELQHALVQMNPLWLNYIWEADPSTATLAGQLHDQFQGTPEQVNYNQAEMQAGAARKAKAIKKAGGARAHRQP